MSPELRQQDVPALPVHPHIEFLTVAVDSREKHPWTLGSLKHVRRTLQTGDYSLCGWENLISIERKSLQDFVSCCSTSRDRFKSELHRLQAYRFRLVLVEDDWPAILGGAYRSKIHPNAVIGSLASWTARYNVPILVTGDRDCAQRIALSFLNSAVGQCAGACPICRGRSL